MLVIIPHEPEKDQEDGWYPSNLDRGGCVIADTEKNLGISVEAFDLMQTIKRNNDSVGDISWWACDDGTHAFSWWGAIYRVIDPNDSEAPRDFYVNNIMWSVCTKIPNDVPPEAMQVIDAGVPETASWKEPFRYETETPSHDMD